MLLRGLLLLGAAHGQVPDTDHCKYWCTKFNCNADAKESCGGCEVCGGTEDSAVCSATRTLCAVRRAPPPPPTRVSHRPAQFLHPPPPPDGHDVRHTSDLATVDESCEAAWLAGDRKAKKDGASGVYWACKHFLRFPGVHSSALKPAVPRVSHTTVSIVGEECAPPMRPAASHSAPLNTARSAASQPRPRARRRPARLHPE